MALVRLFRSMGLNSFVSPDRSTSTFSSSSLCLMRMETRTELTLPSMRHFSCSLRAITSGANSSSFDRRASTSGLLWRSTTCEAKLRIDNAASNVTRIAFKYAV